MALKKIVHPDYTRLESSFEKIIKGDYTPDIVFCNKRNVVEKVTIANEEFVVKRYKRPPLINKIAYCLFRKSKARRAYEYAIELLERGVDTPFPVAYFEFYKNGLFDYGVFISKYVPYRLFENVYDESVPAVERAAILDGFVDFMMYVHKKGIKPMDMNGGNIFYHKDEKSGLYRYALTDINRMQFDVSPGFYDMVFSFEQCFAELDRLSDLARIYGKKVGIDAMVVLYYILSNRMKRVKRIHLRMRMSNRKPE